MNGDGRSLEPPRDPWRDAYRRLQAPGTDRCPDADRLAALVTGEVADDQRRDLADHAVGCRRCSQDLRDLLELHGEAAPALGRGAATRGGSSRRRAGWIAVAATIVVAAGLTLVLREPAPPPVTIERGVAEEASGTVPADGAQLPAAPECFVWRAAPDGEPSWVVLYDVESNVLWRSPRTTAGEVVITEDVRVALERGGTYYWRVVTLRGVDRTLSPLSSFRVAE